MEIKHYKEIYKVIEKYDPAGIAHMSEDEYKSEVTDIANRAYVLSEEKLAEYIYEVFVFWLTETVIKEDKTIYQQMAKEIKALFQTK
jgi:hemerythrin